ncbi:MAG TPA: MFS transporter [Ktedonobacteraceae bacterium]|nr:MFS transporter [Ktedonobacteraceae bacterium]
MSLNIGKDQVQSTTSGASQKASSRWAGLAVVLIATFMAMLDGFIINVAIPSIQRDLQASPTAIELIGAGYSLPYALLVITGGRLGDLYGVRRLFIIGVALFTGFSALCAVAPDAVFLIAARVGQACGGALLYPQVLSFIQQSFQKDERAQALSLWGAIGGLASILGQLIGGGLITANVAGLAWRSVFLVNVPLGIIVLIGAWAFVFDNREPQKAPLDWRGTGLVAIGLLLFLYPLVEGHTLGWPWWIILCLPLALLVIVGFGLFERRIALQGHRPLIDLKLFHLPSFLWGCILEVAWCASTAAFFFILAIYLQNGLGYSAIASGLTFTPLGVILILAAILSSLVVKRLGSWTFALALGLTVIGTFGLLLVANASGSKSPDWILLLLMLLLIGLGLGLGAPTVMTFALGDVPGQESGSASGVMETMMQLGFALGAPLIGLVFFAESGATNEIIAQHVPHAFTQSLLFLGCSLVLLLALIPFLVYTTRKHAQE